MDSILNQPSNVTSLTIKSIDPCSSINSDPGNDQEKQITVFIEGHDYLKLFKEDLRLSRDSAEIALKKVHLIAHHLGPEFSNEFLIPFLMEIQTSLEVTLLPIMCDCWYLISKFLYGLEILKSIFKGLEYLLIQETGKIRVKATEVAMMIIDDFDNNDVLEVDSRSELVNDVICPMIISFVEQDWFPGPTSACYLIPRVYAYASEKSQTELRRLFPILCESDFITVKLAAGINMKQLIPQVQLDHAISMFWLVLKNMSIDNEDKIRKYAVESCLVFAKQCTSEQNLNFNIPILKSASEDASWIVRQYLAENFMTIYQIFEEAEVKENLFDCHVSLLNDNNDRVKSASIQSFSKWSGILSQELIELYVPVLDTLARKSTKEIRRGVCKSLGQFAMKLNKKEVMSVLRPTLQYLLEDEFVEVRLCVVENIHLICDREEFYGVIGEQLIETINMSIENSVWRNRLVIAERLTSFFSHFGATIFEQNFLNVLFKLLLDDVWKVRNAVLNSLEKICNECGSIWAVKFILSELKSLYLMPRQSTYGSNRNISCAIKIVLLQSLVAVAKSIDVENAIEHIVPLLLDSLTDSIPNIRFVCVNSLANLFVIYKNEKPELFLQAKCALIKLCQDSDIDVKYFSKKALDTYEESFRDSLVM
ncbi:phosphorylase phosphatase [Theileria orientalis strain Shintoku]|uniref:Phosphorylase phosphatase n=1 Tax=Theileria orientalis strain Shintoku TaxID=869250 RepID=J4DAL6_THEOR|nr:phosphorylase phosphatase [Theileria orientalis strain Shintoku]BAM42065.1 phosphorylase phosphatase [Theileria orientalis strain Shintoku]|eukprot:XP_009692366.1 phosphorylase phosphatase [Theileria orientalis strain Shintoku]